jgi:hypothetical protein
MGQTVVTKMAALTLRPRRMKGFPGDDRSLRQFDSGLARAPQHVDHAGHPVFRDSRQRQVLTAGQRVSLSRRPPLLHLPGGGEALVRVCPTAGEAEGDGPRDPGNRARPASLVLLAAAQFR